MSTITPMLLHPHLVFVFTITYIHIEITDNVYYNPHATTPTHCICFYNNLHTCKLLLTLLYSLSHNIQIEFSYKDNYVCNILYIERECWIPYTFIPYFAIYIIYERRVLHRQLHLSFDKCF